MLTGEGLRHVEFLGAPEEAQNWFVGSTDFKNASPSDAHPSMITWVSCTARHPRIQCLGKHPTLGSFLSVQNYQWVSLGRCFPVKMSRTTARSREVLVLLSLVCRDHSKHRCSAANMAWDPLASTGLMLTLLGVLARGANFSNVHLASLIEYRKPVSMFMTYPLTAEVLMFSVMKSPQPTRTAVEPACGYRVFVQSR